MNLAQKVLLIAWQRGQVRKNDKYFSTIHSEGPILNAYLQFLYLFHGRSII